MKTVLIFIGLLFSVLSGNVEARPIRFSVDPSRTNVSFDIAAVGFPLTHGEFRSFKGEIVVDLEVPSRSSVSFTVNASSIDTRSSSLDNYIEGPAFLDARRYPTIRFVSTSVEKINEQTVQVTGQLTLLSTTRTARFNVSVDRSSEGRNRFGFSVRGNINRTNFGMTSGVPLISETVSIRVTSEVE